jgi:hypothetical protein
MITIENDDDNLDDLIDVEDCYFIIEWTTDVITQSVVSGDWICSPTPQRTRITTNRAPLARRLFAMIADNLCPDLWIQLDDTHRVLVNRRRPPT